MKNVELQRDGSKLVITIDLAAPASPSSSGKSMIIATTSGNANVPGCTGVKVGVNVYGYDGYTTDETLTPRERGTNPRAMGASPRQSGTNPRAMAGHGAQG